mmetsp:Transcript_376/g.539  ORF Transcript_376/g.539 Transcript_376/m.539 type:complete len:331 (+) Transcript_376:1606-2598(+)
MHILNTSLQSLSGIQEKRTLSLSQLTKTQLIQSILPNRVQNNAVLAVVQRSQRNFLNKLLRDIRNVCFSQIRSDQPLLTRLSLDSIGILKLPQSSQMDRDSVSQDVSFHQIQHSLINRRKIRPNLGDEPLLASNTFLSRTINTVTFGTKTKSTVLTNGVSTDRTDSGNLNTRNVSRWAAKKPFLASRSKLTLSSLEVMDGFQKKRFIGFHNDQRILLHHFFTRIKRERLIENGVLRDSGKRFLLRGKTNLLMTVSKLVVSISIKNGRTTTIPKNRIQDLDVVSGGDIDHLIRAQHNLLMFLSSECSGASDDRGDKGVVVEQVNVLIRFDP